MKGGVPQGSILEPFEFKLELLFCRLFGSRLRMQNCGDLPLPIHSLQLFWENTNSVWFSFIDKAPNHHICHLKTLQSCSPIQASYNSFNCNIIIIQFNQITLSKFSLSPIHTEPIRKKVGNQQIKTSLWSNPERDCGKKNSLLTGRNLHQNQNLPRPVGGWEDSYNVFSWRCV